MRAGKGRGPRVGGAPATLPGACDGAHAPPSVCTFGAGFVLWGARCAPQSAGGAPNGGNREDAGPAGLAPGPRCTFRPGLGREARTGVGWGKSVSVRVGFGGRRDLK